MRTVLFCVCETALQDSNTGGISLINVLSELNAAAIPFVVPRLSVVGIFERNNEESSTQETRLFVSLNGNQLAAVPWTLQFQEKRRVQAVVALAGVVVFDVGAMRVTVDNGTQQSHWDISVSILGPTADMFSQVVQQSVGPVPSASTTAADSDAT